MVEPENIFPNQSIINHSTEMVLYDAPKWIYIFSMLFYEGVLIQRDAPTCICIRKYIQFVANEEFLMQLKSRVWKRKTSVQINERIRLRLPALAWKKALQMVRSHIEVDKL